MVYICRKFLQTCAPPGTDHLEASLATTEIYNGASSGKLRRLSEAASTAKREKSIHGNEFKAFILFVVGGFYQQMLFLAANDKLALKVFICLLSYYIWLDVESVMHPKAVQCAQVHKVVIVSLAFSTGRCN